MHYRLLIHWLCQRLKSLNALARSIRKQQRGHCYTFGKPCENGDPNGRLWESPQMTSFGQQNRQMGVSSGRDISLARCMVEVLEKSPRHLNLGCVAMDWTKLIVMDARKSKNSPDLGETSPSLWKLWLNFFSRVFQTPKLQFLCLWSLLQAFSKLRLTLSLC